MKKKIFLLFLVLVMVLPLCTTGIFGKDAYATSEKIYYSDLFYGYDTSYLSDGSMLKLHIKQTSNMLADIYNDYADDTSSNFWTAFKTALGMSSDALFNLDFREYVALMSDTFGNTNYIYTIFFCYFTIF